MTQTRKEKMSKDEKKTESTRTLIQRIKAMKASKVKKSTETRGEKLAHAKEMRLKEPKIEKTNEMKESPKVKIEAVRSENKCNKNNVDKKL